MAVTPSEEALAQRVVDLSKKTAHVDTGALKRSIHYTVSRGNLVFRQLFYGKYNDNSELIQNAERIMKGIPYSIEELDEEGNIQKSVIKSITGRTITSNEIRSRENKSSSLSARDLITKILSQRKKNGKKNDQKDN